MIIVLYHALIRNLPTVLSLEMINHIYLVRSDSFVCSLTTLVMLRIARGLSMVRLVLLLLLDIAIVVLAWSLSTAASWRSSDGAIVILLLSIGCVLLLLVFFTIDISAVLLNQILSHILHRLLILRYLLLDVFWNNFSALRIHIWILTTDLANLYIILSFVNFLDFHWGSFVGAQIITRLTIELLAEYLYLWRDRVVANITLILSHSHLPLLIHGLLLVLSSLLFTDEILKVALILGVDPCGASTLGLFTNFRIVTHEGCTTWSANMIWITGTALLRISTLSIQLYRDLVILMLAFGNIKVISMSLAIIMILGRMQYLLFIITAELLL